MQLAPARTCAQPGTPSQQPDGGQAAYAAADAAYRALARSDAAGAVDLARRAVQLAPGNAAYARLLVQAFVAAGRNAEAMAAADRALALSPGDVATLTERAKLLEGMGQHERARRDREAALAAPGITPLQRVAVLADLGRMEEAREALRAIPPNAAGDGDADHDMELAYLGVRVNEPRLALAAFQRADRAGKLPPGALRDAAYAADHAGQPEVAAAYFGRAVQASDDGRMKLPPQELFETRRSYAEMVRRWGVFASLGYRSGGSTTPGFGAVPGTPIGANSDAGVEAWWRPMGSRDGRYWELFARDYQTLHSELGDSGSNTRLAGLGGRIKPITDQNLVLSLSRVDSPATGGDWLAQVGYSYDKGTDIRRDRQAWFTARAYGELGRYFRRNQNYAVAGAQLGRSFRVNESDNATIVFPHLGLTAEYDSLAATHHSAAIGPGIAVRQWFRGDTDAAPRSYLDLTVQYRVHLSGDERTRGWFASALLSY